MIIKYIIAILLFSAIILFHELGHFLLAKANGIRVNEFSLGLGPTIVGFTKGETKYSIKLLPFGGACMMEGEDSQSNDDRSFQKKSVWARISVVAAGLVSYTHLDVYKRQIFGRCQSYILFPGSGIHAPSTLQSWMVLK